MKRFAKVFLTISLPLTLALSGCGVEKIKQHSYVKATVIEKDYDKPKTKQVRVSSVKETKDGFVITASAATTTTPAPSTRPTTSSSSSWGTTKSSTSNSSTSSGSSWGSTKSSTPKSSTSSTSKSTTSTPSTSKSTTSTPSTSKSTTSTPSTSKSTTTKKPSTTTKTTSTPVTVPSTDSTPKYKTVYEPAEYDVVLSYKNYEIEVDDKRLYQSVRLGDKVEVRYTKVIEKESKKFVRAYITYEHNY